MPKSISASPSSPAPAEWLLARITDSTRATAIMGDLLEISATRGRLWFWMAYARTLVSVGWRTPVAFVIAIACIRFMLPVFSYILHHRSPHWSDGGLFGEHPAPLVLWFPLMDNARFLFFAVLFALIRFGLRNRLTQLACALFLIILPFYTVRPWVMDLSGVLTALTIVAALIVPIWRRPMIVLAATCVTFTAVMAIRTFMHSIDHQPYDNRFLLTWEAMAGALAVIVCLYLYRRLLGHSTSANLTIA